MIANTDALMDAFWAYEKALGTNDLETMDTLFDDSPDTLRGDPAGLLVGIEEIRRFRLIRPSAPARRILDTHVHHAGDNHALIIAVTELAGGGRGQQTQLWRRRPDNSWVVTAAHVSVPAPALDTRIWRIVGNPLTAPTSSGPLEGHSIAVKDLYAVEGFSIGAGNPHRTANAPIETTNAWAVARLLDAGACIRGIAQTDEYAYSLAGSNAHYGTPPNPNAPGRISGGSSSGSATAVALGHASIGLGTDTGGSIRIPAAYQGLFGIRTTHGAIPTGGLLPLAPRFDTVGWMTRNPRLLRDVGHVLLPATPPSSQERDVVMIADLLTLASPEVAVEIEKFTTSWSDVTREQWPSADPHAWKQAFITAQAVQAWESNREHLANRMDTLGPDIRARFDAASQVTEAQGQAAHHEADRLGSLIRDLVGDKIVVMPSAPTVAPLLGEDVSTVRNATLSLTCVAGLAGLPVVSLPLSTTDGLPCGVALVGPQGTDRELLDLAVTLSDTGVLGHRSPCPPPR